MKRSLGRPRRRRENSIRMDLWLKMDQWRALVSTVMNLRLPYMVGIINESSSP
jgi:hypothetical protein